MWERTQSVVGFGGKSKGKNLKHHIKRNEPPQGLTWRDLRWLPFGIPAVTQVTTSNQLLSCSFTPTASSPYCRLPSPVHLVLQNHGPVPIALSRAL